MTEYTFELIIKSFFIHIIVIIEGESKYKTFKAVKKQIKTNVLSIESELRRGNYRLLYLVVSLDKYNSTTKYKLNPYINLEGLLEFS